MAAELRRVVTSTLEDRDKAIGIGFLIAFVITVVGANWALLTYGIVPIGFGLDAPASVYFVGLTFTFRDGMRERLGFKSALVAIAIGGILSYILEIRQDGDLFARIALASAAAFAVSEFADSLVYERIREYSRLLGIIGSNTVGLVVDSALFLTLAFGSLEFLTGQVVGKFYMTVLAIILIVAWERGRRMRPSTA